MLRANLWNKSVSRVELDQRARDARLRLERAISAGECPQQPDQVDGVVAHRALLRARLDLLTVQAGC